MGQTLASNLDLAKHCYELFAEGRIETLLSDMMAPDIEWTEPDTIPEGGTHHGPAAVMENVFGVLPETWGADIGLVQETWIDGGDHVVLEGRFTGTAPKTGTAYDIPFCHVLRFEAGRLKSFRNYTDTAASLKAING